MVRTVFNAVGICHGHAWKSPHPLRPGVAAARFLVLGIGSNDMDVTDLEKCLDHLVVLLVGQDRRDNVNVMLLKCCRSSWVISTMAGSLWAHQSQSGVRCSIVRTDRAKLCGPVPAEFQ